jgi:hypothetical protein
MVNRNRSVSRQGRGGIPAVRVMEFDGVESVEPTPLILEVRQPRQPRTRTTDGFLALSLASGLALGTLWLASSMVGHPLLLPAPLMHPGPGGLVGAGVLGFAARRLRRLLKDGAVQAREVLVLAAVLVGLVLLSARVLAGLHHQGVVSPDAPARPAVVDTPPDAAGVSIEQLARELVPIA